jgi:2-C-methyl-D-erythritol 4-phosphate cytidylyltransferase
MKNSVTAIIPAAGKGERFSKVEKKQFYEILGEPILLYTLRELIKSYSFKEVIVGASREDFEKIENVFKKLSVENFKIVLGGNERFDTIYNCVNEVSSNFVLIHDAVRPFISKNIITECIETAFEHKAVICGVTPVDTVKVVKNNLVKNTINRDDLILVHTPQVFEKRLLIKALKYQRDNNLFITDEAMAIEALGKSVYLCKSSYENRKLTDKGDLPFFEYMIEKYND